MREAGRRASGSCSTGRTSGEVVLELEEVDGGTRLHVVETSRELETALELHALAWARVA